MAYVVVTWRNCNAVKTSSELHNSSERTYIGRGVRNNTHRFFLATIQTAPGSGGTDVHLENAGIVYLHGLGSWFWRVEILWLTDEGALALSQLAFHTPFKLFRDPDREGSSPTVSSTVVRSSRIEGFSLGMWLAGSAHSSHWKQPMCKTVMCNLEWNFYIVGGDNCSITDDQNLSEMSNEIFEGH